MASSGRRDYQNVPAVDVDDDDLIDPDDADLNTFDDPLTTTTTGTSTSPRPPLTGTIGSGGSSSGGPGSASHQQRQQQQPQQTTQSSSAWSWASSRIPGEDRRAPQSTIDETVWATLRRDLLAVWAKLREVLYPRHLFGGAAPTSLRGAYASLAERALDAESLLGLTTTTTTTTTATTDQQHQQHAGALRDWDMWGPLIFCLLLSTLLCLRSREKQREIVFSGVFAIVWIGMAVVTLQIKLLGGNISFAQSICVIGYTLFPLVIAALLSAVRLHWIARIPVYLFLVAWSLAAGVSILRGSGVVRNRVGLAVYPLFVFYLGLGCLCFIS